MSEPYSKTPEPALKALRSRALLWALAGIVFIGLSMYIGVRYDVGESAKLDWTGVVRQGTAERIESGGWRLRYTHPDEGIFAKSYRGGFGFRRTEGDVFPVALTVSKIDPKDFQPAGASYPSAIPTAALFLLGMYSILHGRRVLLAGLRMRNRQSKK